MGGIRPGRVVRPQRITPEMQGQREEIERLCIPAHYRALHRLLTAPDHYVCLGLGGGSVPGLGGNTALLGLIEELGLASTVREVWGTSAGAVAGAAWASGASAREMLDALQAMHWKGVVDFSRAEFLGRGLARLLSKGQLPDGFIRGRHFREAVRRGLKVSTFERCPVSFRAIACTDDGTARKVVLRSGPLVNAVMASMCLPGIMTPVKDWNGGPHGYFDGGVVEKTPLLSVIEEHNRQLRPQRLVVLCTHYKSGERVHEPQGFMQRFISATYYMEGVIWQGQLEQARRTPNCTSIVLTPRLDEGGMFDFGRVLNHYLAARQQFKAQLSNAGLAKHLAG